METFFLVCFLFGAIVTFASVVLGFAGSALDGLGGHLHLGDFGNGGHHFPAAHDGQLGPGGHVGDLSGGAHHAAADHSPGGHLGFPLVNVSALLAFLTWFGAAGYLLLKFEAWPLWAVLAAAVAAGAAGWLIITAFLARVLAGERVMNPRDYRLEGTIARVTVSIPAGGAGEIVFTIAGARRGEAARSYTGRRIPRGTEVVILDYARGIATVQPYAELLTQPDPDAREPGAPPADRG